MQSYRGDKKKVTDKRTDRHTHRQTTVINTVQLPYLSEGRCKYGLTQLYSCKATANASWSFTVNAIFVTEEIKDSIPVYLLIIEALKMLLANSVAPDQTAGMCRFISGYTGRKCIYGPFLIN